MIDTSGRGIRKSVPPKFPYFHVQFGMTRGYAQVIEKQNKFDPEFGHQVLAAILGKKDRFTEGKIQRKTIEEEQADVKTFLSEWILFDWTSELDGGAL